MKRIALTTALLAMTLTSCMHGPTAETRQTLFVLKGARIIDGSAQPPRENAAIVIRNGVIEAIQDANGALPEDAKVIDVTGKTLMPTLIAAHSHLGITNGAKAGTEEITETNVTRQLKKYARFGVGTVMSLGTDHEFIYGMRTRRLKTANQTPFIMTAGRGFGVFDGAPPITMGMDQVYRPTSAAKAESDMKELAAKKPDVVKLWVDDFNHTLKHKMDPKIYRTIIKDAHAANLKVAAHVYYLSDAKQLAKDGADIFGHSVRDKKIDPALIAEMKKRDIAYIPTLQLDDAAFIYADKPAWMNEEFFKKALDPGVEHYLSSKAYQPKEISRKNLKIAKENAVALLRAGIRVGMGTDSGATIPRLQGFAEHRELELLVEAGFTPSEAIQAATSVNASILGISATRGTLAPGKVADILVLDADPLTDIRNTRKINSVWLEGVQVAGGIAP